MKDILGFGLTRPFQRDQRSDLAAAGDERLIRSCVGQILGTVGSSEFTQGELPWRTEFGSLLYLLRLQKNDNVLQELARVYVVDALARWEPRVVVSSVQVARELQVGESALVIRLRYSVTSANTPGVLALSDIEQAVLV